MWIVVKLLRKSWMILMSGWMKFGKTFDIVVVVAAVAAAVIQMNCFHV
jgi:hypothetical protein